MEDYRKVREDEKARTQEVHERIKTACIKLGYTPAKGTADSETQGPWQTIAAKEGAPDLFFRCHGGDKRIEARGGYPRSADGTNSGTLYFTVEEREAIKAGTFSGPLARYAGAYGTIDQPKITLDRGKNPEQIAKDVKRRLIPAITAYYERVTAWVAEHDDYNTTSAATLAAIKAAALTKDEARGFGYTEYIAPKDGRKNAI
ncbi:MAG: hypothetical protein WAY02_08545, partial [Burkholderiaceae bacterium]